MTRPHKFGAVRTKRATPEQDLHMAVASYLRAALRPAEVLWSTFPAGGGGKVRGGILNGMGLQKGWPDITLYWDNGDLVYNPIEVGHFELKSAKGRMSTEQVEFAQRCEALGHHHAIVRGIDDLRKALREWDVPTRESK